jgi:hypothetical protein
MPNLRGVRVASDRDGRRLLLYPGTKETIESAFSALMHAEVLMKRQQVDACIVGYLRRRYDVLYLALDSVPVRSRRYENTILEIDEVEGLLEDLGQPMPRKVFEAV